MKFITLRNGILLGLLVVIISAVLYHYSYRFTPVEFKDYDEWINEKDRSLGEIMRYSEALEEAYRNDTAGGSTPEETLALWVEAVQADDLEKASTYFLVDNRTNALEGMKESKKNNVLPKLIVDIQDGGKWEVSNETGSALFETADGSELGYYLEFIKNPYTDIWKLEEF